MTSGPPLKRLHLPQCSARRYFSDPGEDDPNPAVAERQGRLHPEGVPQQEPCRSVGLPQGDRLHGDHVASILQDHRVGAGEYILFHGSQGFKLTNKGLRRQRRVLRDGLLKTSVPRPRDNILS